MNLGVVEFALTQYALWVKNSHSYAAHGVLGYMSERGPSELCMTDNKALVVRTELEKLKARDEESRKIVDLYFFDGKNYSEIGREFGLSREKARIKYISVMHWLDASMREKLLK